MDILKSVINGICYEVCVAQRLSRFSHHLYASTKWCSLIQLIRYFCSDNLNSNDVGSLITQLIAASLISGILTHTLFLRVIIHELEALAEVFQKNNAFSYIPVFSCIGFLLSSPAISALTLMSVVHFIGV
jgi:hypothetical protein